MKLSFDVTNNFIHPDEVIPRELQRLRNLLREKQPDKTGHGREEEREVILTMERACHKMNRMTGILLQDLLVAALLLFPYVVIAR